ncbi:unnamed protein product [Euphydryas editha]|uniref:Seminal fluid protein n=1 Tax=Euphydryas editha TaxID=104508 RepID=A0AAU9UVG5_EUPED|nr:unnamed protein product [Euphydryas editha]
MWEYLAVLLLGFWLGVAIFLYVSCYWLEEILDLPKQRLGHNAHNHTGASGAHAQLKRLVARVVEEAAALPALARYAAEEHTPTETSTYEDLLATAILNKVIERYQTESGSGGRSSGIHSASASPSPSDRSSPRSLNSRTTREITPPIHAEDDASDWEEGEATDEAPEVPRRVPFPEFGGDIVHTSDNEFRDFDEISGSDIQAVDGSWEENWLFQKKKIKNIQSAPVPMLVPNSNTQYRALIGDRDADDTTDLSDNGSDNEEELEYTSDVKKVLNSKHVIGGKPKLEEILDFEPDSLMIIDSNEEFERTDKIIEKEEPVTTGDKDVFNQKDIKHEKIVYNTNDNGHDSILVLGVNSGPISMAEFNLKEEIHRTTLNGHADNFANDTTGEDTTDSSINPKIKETANTLSRSEREKEYEETETLPIQRYADSLRKKHFEEYQEFSPPNPEKEDNLIPGSIADRERKKWLNYVEMPNNPYSPEAIQKRLSAKNTSSLFDIITTKKDLEEPNVPRENVPKMNNGIHSFNQQETIGDHFEDKMDKRQLNLSISTDDDTSEKGSISPSPKMLKDVLSDEVSQYKRYGRDYYIRQARSSSGERRGPSSLSSSVNRSMSSESVDAPASPVSASSALSELEAAALRTSVARAVLRPPRASPNFAINPIFETDRRDCPDHPDHTPDRPDRSPDCPDSGLYSVDASDNFYPDDGDLIRLEIPQKPEIMENLFEKYSDIRRSDSLRSEDLCHRSKRRPPLNFTFGGSVRLSKGFRRDLW